MSIRVLTTGAIALLVAGPAVADCGADVARLDAAVIQAETGASDSPSGLPATEHQQSVLAGKEDAGAVGAAGPAATEGEGAGSSDMPGSPHQQQVLGGQDGKGAAGGMAGGDPADLLAKARELAAAGDEQGCMEQVSQLKSQLGIK